MTDHRPTSTASTAFRPDLDWSQVRETITMLCLAVAQLRCTMTDGDSSVNSLASQFTQLSTQAFAMRSCLNGITATSDPLQIKAELQPHTETALAGIDQAITNFQFYDRFSQRLDHVAHSLQKLSQLIGTPDQLYNPAAWATIQNDIRQSYSMESERLMFEHILRGASVEEALAVYRHHFSREKAVDDNTDDEIELF
jgi:hypothetical protein